MRTKTPHTLAEKELREALAGFDLLYLIPAVTVSLLIQVFRAWRWKIELSPLADLKFSYRT